MFYSLCQSPCQVSQNCTVGPTVREKLLVQTQLLALPSLTLSIMVPHGLQYVLLLPHVSSFTLFAVSTRLTQNTHQPD